MIREGPPVAGVNCARHIGINQDKKPTKRFNAVGVGEGWARWAGSSCGRMLHPCAKELI